MANRRLHTLTRLYNSTHYSNRSLQILKTLDPQSQSIITPPNHSLLPVNAKFYDIFSNLKPYSQTHFQISRHFSHNQRNDSDKNDETEDEDDDEEEEMDESGDDEDFSTSNPGVVREYSMEEKKNEAAAIGYKVIGQLERSDRVFKDYEPVFAVVQIGSHQFKLSNGDCIYTERLKFCEVNDKLILNKVLMMGSKTQTMIGRPILPDAAVHAVVEEHALDAKVIIFKKKRRKNYRRMKGHRQELTKLRITDMQGIEKLEVPKPEKTEKATSKKVERVAVAA